MLNQIRTLIRQTPEGEAKEQLLDEAWLLAYPRETLEDINERLAFEAKLVSQDPDLVKHYGLEV